MCQRFQGLDGGSLEAPGYNPQAFILDLLQLPRGRCATSLVSVRRQNLTKAARGN